MKQERTLLPQSLRRSVRSMTLPYGAWGCLRQKQGRRPSGRPRLRLQVPGGGYRPGRPGPISPQFPARPTIRLWGLGLSGSGGSGAGPAWNLRWGVQATSRLLSGVPGSWVPCAPSSALAGQIPRAADTRCPSGCRRGLLRQSQHSEPRHRAAGAISLQPCPCPAVLLKRRISRSKWGKLHSLEAVLLSTWGTERPPRGTGGSEWTVATADLSVYHETLKNTTLSSSNLFPSHSAVTTPCDARVVQETWESRERVQGKVGVCPPMPAAPARMLFPVCIYKQNRKISQFFKQLCCC